MYQKQAKIFFALIVCCCFANVYANTGLLSKLAVESKVQGDAERRTGVYTLVHEDSSTASTQQFASTVEFGKKSTVMPDSAAPVHIKSDHASFDHKLGVAVYEGHVEVDQGTRHLSANKLTIERDSKNQIKVMTATGNPATFKSQQNPEKIPGRGSAKIIKYYPQLEKVDLFHQAKLMQGDDTITGPKLSYNFVTEVLQGNSSKRERTTVILQPKSQTQVKRAQ